jgi:hypothetical protein
MTYRHWRKTKMPKVDMSAEAIATRLKRVSQLRRLGLSLQKAKIKAKPDKAKGVDQKTESPSISDSRKSG